MEVIYEDNHIIVVAKESGEIVQGDKTGDTPLSETVKQYIKEAYAKPGVVFLGVVHRLDRPVSGLVLFARTSKDGQTWNNMPGSPLEVKSETLGIGAYQTTYTENISWVKLSDFVIYQKPTR